MNDYANAFSELLEVLNHIPRNEYNKIPKKFLNTLRQHCNSESSFKYNTALPLEKQNISNDTKVLLCLLNTTCWKINK